MLSLMATGIPASAGVVARFDFLVNRVSSFQRTGAIDFEKGVEFIVQSFGRRDGRLHGGAGGHAAAADLISKCRYGFVHSCLNAGQCADSAEYFRNAKVSRRRIWRLIEREFLPERRLHFVGAR